MRTTFDDGGAFCDDDDDDFFCDDDDDFLYDDGDDDDDDDDDATYDGDDDAKRTILTHSPRLFFLPHSSSSYHFLSLHVLFPLHPQKTSTRNRKNKMKTMMSARLRHHPLLEKSFWTLWTLLFFEVRFYEN